MILPVKDDFKRQLKKYLPDEVVKKVSLISDTEMFQYKEDKSVWEQKRDKRPVYFQVFYDDVFISGFDLVTNRQVAIVEFLKGMKEKYKQKKITLTMQEFVSKQDMEEEKKRKEKQKQKEMLDKLATDTKEEKMAKEIIKKLNDPKKKKKPLPSTTKAN